MSLDVYIIGEAHFSPAVVDKEIEIIRKIRPKVVLIEGLGDYDEKKVLEYLIPLLKYYTFSDLLAYPLNVIDKDSMCRVICDEIRILYQRKIEECRERIGKEFLEHGELVRRISEGRIAGIIKILRKMDEGNVVLDPKYIPVPVKRPIEVRKEDILNLPIYILNTAMVSGVLWRDMYSIVHGFIRILDKIDTYIRKGCGGWISKEEIRREVEKIVRGEVKQIKREIKRIKIKDEIEWVRTLEKGLVVYGDISKMIKTLEEILEVIGYYSTAHFRYKLYRIFSKELCKIFFWDREINDSYSKDMIFDIYVKLYKVLHKLGCVVAGCDPVRYSGSNAEREYEMARIAKKYLDKYGAPVVMIIGAHHVDGVKRHLEEMGVKNISVYKFLAEISTHRDIAYLLLVLADYLLLEMQASLL